MPWGARKRSWVSQKEKWLRHWANLGATNGILHGMYLESSHSPTLWECSWRFDVSLTRWLWGYGHHGVPKLWGLFDSRRSGRSFTEKSTACENQSRRSFRITVVPCEYSPRMISNTLFKLLRIGRTRKPAQLLPLIVWNRLILSTDNCKTWRSQSGCIVWTALSGNGSSVRYAGQG